MTIKIGEVGKEFNYSTLFDLSAFTGLELKFTSPTGVITILTSAGGRVSAPAVFIPSVPATATEDEVPAIAASTYMQITTIATDFTEVGTWTVCGTYNDATPKEFFGDDATFEIGDDC